MMHWKAIGRKRLCPNWGTIHAHTWRDWGNPRTISAFPVSTLRFEPKTYRTQMWSVLPTKFLLVFLLAALTWINTQFSSLPPNTKSARNYIKMFPLLHKHKRIIFNPSCKNKHVLPLTQYKIFSKMSALQKAMLAVIHSDVIRDAITHTNKIGDVMM
jgi:hypothetical protein